MSKNNIKTNLLNFETQLKQTTLLYLVCVKPSPELREQNFQETTS